MVGCVGRCICLGGMEYLVLVFAALCFQSMGHPCTLSRSSLGGAVTADCRSRDLSSIPTDLPIDTTILMLSRNRLVTIPPGHLAYLTNLKHLDISRNGIRAFDVDSFSGLSGLEELVANHNALCMTYESFPQTLFQKTPSLKALRIHSMCCETHNQSYLEKTIIHLSHLEELTMPGLPDREFGPGYGKLRRLRKLHLTGDCCNMTIIREKTFSVFQKSNIEELSLQKCAVTTIARQGLKHFNKLKVINMACNWGITLNKTLAALHHLSPGTLHTAILDGLAPPDGAYIYTQLWKSDFCKNQIFSNLKRLTIRKNEIILADTRMFECLKNIEYFGLGYNFPLPSNPDGLRVLIDLLNDTKLRTVDASNFGQTYGPDYRRSYCDHYSTEDFFKKPFYARGRDVSSASAGSIKNQVQRKPTGFSKKSSEIIQISQGVINTPKNNMSTRISMLNAMSDKKIRHKKHPIVFPVKTTRNSHSEDSDKRRLGDQGGRELNSSVVDHRTSRYAEVLKKSEAYFLHHIPYTVEYLYLDNIPGGKTGGDGRNDSANINNNIRLINVSYDKIGYVSFPIRGFSKLEVLDVRNGHSLCNVCDDALDYVPRLRYLNMAGNILGLCGQTFARLFQKVVNLEFLDISSNYIFYIHPNAFNKLSVLKELHLQHNTLSSEAQFDISGLHQLINLDLSNNSLTSLNESVTTQLEWLAETSPLVLILRDNPFMCDCPQMYFLKWLMVTNVTLPKKERYICSLFGDKVPVLKVDLKRMAKICTRPYLPMILIIALCCGLSVVTVGTISAMYHWRWTLRWYYYLLRRRMRLVYGVGADGGGHVFKYRAFIAHNHAEDFDWVVDTLIPQIEDNWGLTCCLGYRDFEPGVPVAENIVNAIDNSWRTILVVTPGFACSQWCDFEMHMALSRGRSTIVMLYVQEVGVEDMSATLRALMRGTNYIPWEGDAVGQRRFWTRLKDALSNTADVE